MIDPNMFEANLEDLDLDALTRSCDAFSLTILRSIYSEEQIAKLDEKGLARGIAVTTCCRYVEAMRVLVQRHVALQNARTSLDRLVG
jgi:hypothetical protein